MTGRPYLWLLLFGDFTDDCSCWWIHMDDLVGDVSCPTLPMTSGQAFIKHCSESLPTDGFPHLLRKLTAEAE